MHSYSIDSHPREKLIFWLSFAAILLTPKLTQWANGLLSNELVKDIFEKFSIFHPIIVSLPVVIIFGGLFLLFDRCLWKLKLIRKLIIVPDLNGKWQCEGQTIFKNGQAVNHQWQGTLKVTQSWSKIMILMDTGDSNSESVSATLCYKEGVGHKIFYQYESKPKASNNDMRAHSGAIELTFNAEIEGGEGYYYTDHQRSTVGKIVIRKSKEE